MSIQQAAGDSKLYNMNDRTKSGQDINKFQDTIIEVNNQRETIGRAIPGTNINQYSKKVPLPKQKGITNFMNQGDEDDWEEAYDQKKDQLDDGAFGPLVNNYKKTLEYKKILFEGDDSVRGNRYFKATGSECIKCNWIGGNTAGIKQDGTQAGLTCEEGENSYTNRYTLYDNMSYSDNRGLVPSALEGGFKAIRLGMMDLAGAITEKDSTVKCVPFTAKTINNDGVAVMETQYINHKDADNYNSCAWGTNTFKVNGVTKNCPFKDAKASNWNEILVPHILKIQNFNSKMEASELKENDFRNMFQTINYLNMQEVPYSEPERPISNTDEKILLSEQVDKLIFGLYNIRRDYENNMLYYFHDIANKLEKMINIDYSEYYYLLDSLKTDNTSKNSQVKDGFTNLSKNEGLQPFFSKNTGINVNLSNEPLDNIYIFGVGVFTLYIIKRLLDKQG